MPLQFCALSLSEVADVPEELLPDPEGSLMGGGRCFTPFPNTDVWTSGEIPSPCRQHLSSLLAIVYHNCNTKVTMPIANHKSRVGP